MAIVPVEKVTLKRSHEGGKRAGHAEIWSMSVLAMFTKVGTFLAGVLCSSNRVIDGERGRKYNLSSRSEGGTFRAQ